MDRDPGRPSRKCPKCGEKAFRQGIATHFIRHYYAYCKCCGYKTEPSPSEQHGIKEWMEAGE